MFLGHTACAGSRSAVSHAPSAFAYEKLTLENAVFDELYATAQPIGDFDGTIPENWTFDTYLHASFSGNLYGGNVNFTEDLVEAIRIKRRTKKDAQFQTIYEKPIYENEDFAIELLDYLEPAGPVEYAYVPVISGGESNYIITSVTSDFEGYFLCEKDRSFHLFLDAHQYTGFFHRSGYGAPHAAPKGRKTPAPDGKHPAHPEYGCPWDDYTQAPEGLPNRWHKAAVVPGTWDSSPVWAQAG